MKAKNGFLLNETTPALAASITLPAEKSKRAAETLDAVLYPSRKPLRKKSCTFPKISVIFFHTKKFAVD